MIIKICNYTFSRKKLHPRIDDADLLLAQHGRSVRVGPVVLALPDNLLLQIERGRQLVRFDLLLEQEVLVLLQRFAIQLLLLFLFTRLT